MRRIIPTNEIKMSTTTDYEGLAHHYVSFLDERRGKDNTARIVGVAPGTIFNIRRRRLKNIGARLFSNLHRAFVNALETELRKLDHELQIARQSGLGDDESEVSAASAALAELKEAIRGLRQ